MIFQLIILSIVTFFAPLLPPVLVPLGYSLAGVLLVQKINPRMLSVIMVFVSVAAVMIIWILQNHIIQRVATYEKGNTTNRVYRIMNRINTYFEKQEKLVRLSQRRERYLKTKPGRFWTFIFAVCLFLPILPDIIGIRLLYKKIKFPYFVLAVFIWKTITYVPFIFLWLWLLQLLHLQMDRIIVYLYPIL